jgi:phytoene dehydrogenase-like protein
LLSAQRLARRFHTEEGRALVAGTAAHSMLPLTAPLSGVFPRLFTALAHRYGWPVVEGGSSAIIDALVAELAAVGGRIETGRLVRRLDELPPAAAVVLDVTPRQLMGLAGDALPTGSRRALARYRYGPGVCKVDWALRGPVPWSAEGCREAVTVHVGGTFEEIARSEADVNAGRHPDRPFCLVTQPCLVDPGRAPAGRHTLWAYCHVPNGSPVDMTDRIEAQIERFAPGFRDLILARSTMSAVATEEHNPSYVGGDINAGAATLRQMVFRPTARWNPYRTALKGVYLCSAATPPGGGVHGMCGIGAATAALRDLGAT